MKKKLYTLLCGAAVVAMAGAALVQHNGDVAGDRVRPNASWTPAAPTIEAAFADGAVTGEVTAPYQGKYLTLVDLENLPEDFKQTITVYRATTSYGVGEAVYTKTNVAVADVLNFTDNSQLADGTYYYYAVSTNDANTERVSPQSERVAVEVKAAPERPEKLYLVGSFNDWSMDSGYLTLNYDEDQECYAGMFFPEEDGTNLGTVGHSVCFEFGVYSALVAFDKYGYMPSKTEECGIVCDVTPVEFALQYQGPLYEGTTSWWHFPDIVEAPIAFACYVFLDGDNSRIITQFWTAPSTTPDKVPQAAELTAIVNAGAVDVTVTAPTKYNSVTTRTDEMGDPIYETEEMPLGNGDLTKIELYRFADGEDAVLVKTWEDPANGAELTYNDNSVVAGKTYTYYTLTYMLAGKSEAKSQEVTVEIPADDLDLRIVRYGETYEQSTWKLYKEVYIGEVYITHDPYEFEADEDGLMFRIIDKNGTVYAAGEEDNKMAELEDGEYMDTDVVVGGEGYWWFADCTKGGYLGLQIDPANLYIIVRIEEAEVADSYYPDAPELTASYNAATKAVEGTVTLAETCTKVIGDWEKTESVECPLDMITKVEVYRGYGFEWPVVVATFEAPFTDRVINFTDDSELVEGTTYEYWAKVYMGTNDATSARQKVLVSAQAIEAKAATVQLDWYDEDRDGLKVSWTLPADVISGTVKSFTIVANDKTIAANLPGNLRKYYFEIGSGMKPAYTVTVETEYIDGQKAVSEPVSFTCYTESPVTDVQAVTNETYTGVEISWTIPEMETPFAIVGFNVKVNGEVVNEKLLAKDVNEFAYAYPEGTLDATKWQIVVETVYGSGNTVASEVVDYTVTSVEELFVEGSDVEVYTLSGVRVKNPGTGIYIVRKNGETHKVAIRK